MHTYLESIGFGKIKSHSELNQLVRDVVLHFERKSLFRTESGRIYGEFSRDYAQNIGITVCGEFDDSGDFHLEYSFPYFTGKTVSMIQEVDFEKHAASESYAGACDDPRIGATIIFYLSNMGQMMDAKHRGASPEGVKPVRLSALAREGQILLPVQKTARDEEIHQKWSEKHYGLVKKAKGGDEDAMEALATEEMNNYNIVTKRLEEEDVLSIVDSSFLPYGIECDQYNVIGNITSCGKVKNQYTGESVWQMQIESCDVYYELCINESKLRGVPEPGRRFRGMIWLQGQVGF
jgi:hypothetical protein